MKELKGEKVDVKTNVKVETNISAYLSHNYVSSSARRMSIYRDIANLQNLESMVQFVKDTESVFGDMPEELINLCKIGVIKNMCSLIGVNRVTIRDKAVIYFENKEFLNENVLNAIDEYKENINLNLSNLSILEINGVKREEMLDFLINYLQLINKN